MCLIWIRYVAWYKHKIVSLFCHLTRYNFWLSSFDPQGKIIRQRVLSQSPSGIGTPVRATFAAIRCQEEKFPPEKSLNPWAQLFVVRSQAAVPARSMSDGPTQRKNKRFKSIICHIQIEILFIFLQKSKAKWISLSLRSEAGKHKHMSVTDLEIPIAAPPLPHRLEWWNVRGTEGKFNAKCKTTPTEVGSTNNTSVRCSHVVQKVALEQLVSGRNASQRWHSSAEMGWASHRRFAEQTESPWCIIAIWVLTWIKILSVLFLRHAWNEWFSHLSVRQEFHQSPVKFLGMDFIVLQSKFTVPDGKA